MVKVNLGGCSSFVKDADYNDYVTKALAALDTLESGSGAGNDFLGWKHLPSETPESLSFTYGFSDKPALHEIKAAAKKSTEIKVIFEKIDFLLLILLFLYSNIFFIINFLRCILIL